MTDEKVEEFKTRDNRKNQPVDFSISVTPSHFSLHS